MRSGGGIDAGAPRLVAAPPSIPLTGHPVSPAWGRQATLDHWGDKHRTDAVDSVTAGTHEERAEIEERSRGTWTMASRLPIPLPVRRLVMDERVLAGFRASRTPIPPPYYLDVAANGFARPVFTLRFRDADAIAALFNHPGGLRGHYFISPTAGDDFTQKVIRDLLPLLMAVARDWSGDAASAGRWLEDTEPLLRASLLAGKVWLHEPWEGRATLADHGLANPRWVARTDSRALVVRRGFIAAVRAAEPTAASADSFFASATNAFGLLGTSDAVAGADHWRAQDMGAAYMGTRGFTCLEIKGAFVNAAGNTWTPERKRHNSLSLHWLGFS